MKQIRYIIGIFFVSLSFLLIHPVVYAEQINTFNAQYTIETNGTITVNEEIEYDFGTLIRHGIFRTIPLRRTNTDGKTYEASITDISVTDENNNAYTYVLSTENGRETIKIGDSDALITGTKKYVIRYVVSGAITYFSDHDELYWNITGNEWPVEMSDVQADIVLPSQIHQSDIQVLCFTGKPASTASDCSAGVLQNTVSVKTNITLGPNEGTTVAVKFPKNFVSVLEPKQVINLMDNPIVRVFMILLYIVTVVAGIIWYIGLPVWIIVRWYRYGRDPKPAMGVASAWFEAPKASNGRLLTPGETGTLIDEEAGMQEITATIVDLARRGYMKIVEKKKNDFSFIKTKEYKKDLTIQSHEEILLRNLFESKNEVRIKDADLIPVVSAMQNTLYTSVVDEKFFDTNPQATRTKYYILAGVALFSMNIWLAIIAFLFGRAMPRKTISGAQAAAVAMSLKNFLVSQTRWITGIAKNQLMFEKLLPYATAFGAEKIWAERFKDISMSDPDWYQGYGNHTFSSVYLVNSLSHTHSNFISSSTPTRSSSGFSSGFSGGSSGGGGGGGGGGSW